MRILLTADLHYNHPRSREGAEAVIEQINSAGGDVLVVIGDTAVADGDGLEQCLERFRFVGPKLFVAGNHELWTKTGDSYAIFTQDLPRRVNAMGWHWLESEPWVGGDVAIVGSVGWYDYSFAPPHLGIPQRFYEAKVSPGAARQFGQFAPLFEQQEDIAPQAREITARWNDGRFVKLGRGDAEFLEEILARLDARLQSLSDMREVIAAVHHVPLRELLPPPHSAQWDFAKAFLGSDRIGDLLLRHANVRHIFCGHSHLARQAKIGEVTAVNIGSGYRWKTYRELDVAG